MKKIIQIVIFTLLSLNVVLVAICLRQSQGLIESESKLVSKMSAAIERIKNEYSSRQNQFRALAQIQLKALRSNQFNSASCAYELIETLGEANIQPEDIGTTRREIMELFTK